MDKINFINPAAKRLKIKGKTTMVSLDENIKMIVKKLKNRDREIPEYGDFRPVREEFLNPDKKLSVTNFVLEINKPSKNIDGHEKLRNLTAQAYNLPHPYKSQILLATGSKNDIFNALNDEEFLEKLPKIFKKLARDLEDA